MKLVLIKLFGAVIASLLFLAGCQTTDAVSEKSAPAAVATTQTVTQPVTSTNLEKPIGTWVWGTQIGPCELHISAIDDKGVISGTYTPIWNKQWTNTFGKDGATAALKDGTIYITLSSGSSFKLDKWNDEGMTGEFTNVRSKNSEDVIFKRKS
ncbi:hypothetical protein [Sneathiella sp.]|uniref:hypothetical protein n=1 Tax=Sneathiella sp. TaxID=1964365 RepID=UPI0035683923